MISDNEVEMLKADAAMDLQNPDLCPDRALPACYMPIWVVVESPKERIRRAVEQYNAVAGPEAPTMEDTSGKDTDSNGTKETEVKEVTAGLTTGSKSPKPQRERKKSKSKNGEDKSSDDGENTVAKTPTTPPKVEVTNGDNKSPEKASKSPKNTVGGENMEIEKTPELNN